MELKSSVMINGVFRYSCFNRTFMELKSVYLILNKLISYEF